MLDTPAPVGALANGIRLGPHDRANSSITHGCRTGAAHLTQTGRSRSGGRERRPSALRPESNQPRLYAQVASTNESSPSVWWLQTSLNPHLTPCGPGEMETPWMSTALPALAM